MNKSVKELKEECKVIYQNVELDVLSRGDIELLRSWRNDESQTRFLRKIGYITKEMQKAWFDSYLQDDTQIVFSIFEKNTLNKMVGSVALYNIDIASRICEVGKIQIGVEEAHGMGIGRISLVGAIKVAFSCLGVDKIVASVHKDNVQAHTNDLKIGFRIIGEKESVVGGFEDLLEMTEEDVATANQYYKDIRIVY